MGMGRTARLGLIALAASFGLGSDCHGDLPGSGSAPSAAVSLDVQSLGPLRRLLRTDTWYGPTGGRLAVRRAPDDLAHSISLSDKPDDSTSRPDRRLAIIGRKAGGGLMLDVQRTLEPPFEFQVTVALDEPPERGSLPAATLKLSWDRPWLIPSSPLSIAPPDDHFLLRAERAPGAEQWSVHSELRLNAVPFGPASSADATLAGPRQIDLRIEHDGDWMRTLIRPTPTDGAALPWVLLDTVSVGEPFYGESRYQASFGGTGLNPGDALLFEHMSFEGLAPAGWKEQPLLDGLEPVLAQLAVADALTAGELFDEPAAATAIGFALMGLDMTLTNLVSAMEGKGMSTLAFAARARRNLARARARADQAACKLPSAPPEHVNKLVRASVDRVLLAMANLNGLRVGRIEQLPLGPAPLD
jgi:hypothetical protein